MHMVLTLTLFVGESMSSLATLAVRLAGIEPALTVPKTGVLSIERQAPFDYAQGKLKLLYLTFSL